MITKQASVKEKISCIHSVLWTTKAKVSMYACHARAWSQNKHGYKKNRVSSEYLYVCMYAWKENWKQDRREIY